MYALRYMRLSVNIDVIEKALKRAVKLKQTVYLCNRNKTIINQVRVGLHGGFSVLSSNSY